MYISVQMAPNVWWTKGYCAGRRHCTRVQWLPHHHLQFSDIWLRSYCKQGQVHLKIALDKALKVANCKLNSGIFSTLCGDMVRVTTLLLHSYLQQCSRIFSTYVGKSCRKPLPFGVLRMCSKKSKYRIRINVEHDMQAKLSIIFPDFKAVLDSILVRLGK